MTFDVYEQSVFLQSACRRLTLHPQEEAFRRDMMRAIARVPLIPDLAEMAVVRFLASDARDHANSLAFRLEGPGCTRLVVCVETAALARALALLQEQLRKRHNYGARLSRH